jgi:hypothetical protein
MRSLMLIAAAGFLLAAGCEKKKAKTTPTTAATAKGGDTPPPAAGGGNTNYQGGAGAAQNIRKAGKRTVALNDMKTLGQAIELKYNDLGKMPTKQEILADLSQYPNILSLVKDGTVILTGTTDHAGLWAYEVEADTKGGIGLVGGVANRYDAATIKQYLGR